MNSNLKKLLGFRNMQEKLENAFVFVFQSQSSYSSALLVRGKLFFQFISCQRFNNTGCMCLCMFKTLIWLLMNMKNEFFYLITLNLNLWKCPKFTSTGNTLHSACRSSFTIVSAIWNKYWFTHVNIHKYTRVHKVFRQFLIWLIPQLIPLYTYLIQNK